MERKSYEWWENFEKELRKKGQMPCPKCGEGVVTPYGKGVTKDNARNFICNKCTFRIVEG